MIIIPIVQLRKLKLQEVKKKKNFFCPKSPIGQEVAEPELEPEACILPCPEAGLGHRARTVTVCGLPRESLGTKPLGGVCCDIARHEIWPKPSSLALFSTVSHPTPSPFCTLDTLSFSVPECAMASPLWLTPDCP